MWMTKRIFLLLSVAAIVFAACGSNTATNAPGPTTLIMGEWQPATQLNPFYSSSVGDFEAIQVVMRGFLTIDSTGNYVPDLATAVPSKANGGLVIDADGKGMTVNVTLKPNLKWSDGQPLTGEDFKYTVTWAQDPGQKGCIACGSGYMIPDASGNNVPLIDKVTVGSDGLAIAMHFNQLFSSYLNFLSGPATILPEHYMKNIPIADAATKSMPVSADAVKVPWSGPYMITAASPTEIDFTPNPYWAAGVSGPHAPKITNLKLQYFTDKDGMIAAFKNGEIDLAFDMNMADTKSVAATDPKIGKADSVPAWSYEHFDMNEASTTAPFLADLNVRKAISESIDKQSMIDAVFPGAGVSPACSPVSPGLWYRSDVTCPGYNVSDAKSLLDAANLPVGSDGSRTYNGKTIDLLLCTTSGNSVRLTELQKLQGDLQAIGIKSHIQTADATSVVFASWTDTEATPDTACEMYRGNYDIVDYRYVNTGSPYIDYYPTYQSTQWPENAATNHGGSNDTRFSSPAMDAALAPLQTAVDQADQKAAMVAVQDAYVAGLPEVPLYYLSETTGVGVHVGGWPGFNPSSIGPTWDVEDWYVK
jgi:peptide/nickel transport system substrate-binding protein